MEKKIEPRKPKKKLLFVINSLSAAGAEKVLVDLLRGLGDEYEITVQTLVDLPVLLPRLEGKVKYKPLLRIKNKYIRQLGTGFVQRFVPMGLLHRLWVGNNFDTEVAYLESFPTKLLASSANKHSKKLAWVHVDVIKHARQDKIFRSRRHQISCYEKFDKIFCVSDSVKEAFNKKYGLPDKTEVLHNVYDDRFIKDMACAEKIEKKNNVIRLVSVGRLTNQKGYDRLLNVVSRLKNSGLNCELLILGDGDLRSSLQKQISDLKAESFIHLLGVRENPYPIMASADLYVCSSRTEGYSTVVCESLILGVPILTTHCAGMDEILDGGKYGLIVENSEDGLEKGLNTLLSDRDLLSDYRQKAIERGKFFNLEKQINKYKEIL